jgi:hypothetical protein
LSLLSEIEDDTFGHGILPAFEATGALSFASSVLPGPKYRPARPRVTEANGETRRGIRNAESDESPKLSFPVQRWSYI